MDDFNIAGEYPENMMIARPYRGGRLTEVYYYNRALALEKLGRDREAMEIFDGLILVGQRRIHSSKVDFFAKFCEKQTSAENLAKAYYLLGLGYLGKRMKKKVQDMFSESVRLNLNHVWANYFCNYSDSNRRARPFILKK